jgi:uncharacterized protein
MRRKDKEISDIKVIKDIIKEADFCNVAMSKNNMPYVVPMNFGFDEESLYLHSVNEGLKIDILLSNPNVCLGIVNNAKIKKASDLCKTTMRFKSVIIFGKAEFITDNCEKGKALKIIVNHYYGDDPVFVERELKFGQSVLEQLVILKVKIEKISGKQSA